MTERLVAYYLQTSILETPSCRDGEDISVWMEIEHGSCDVVCRRCQ
jgi:hypothetical protein